MNVNKLMDMFIEIAQKIEIEKDYITELDSVLGDGDHWVNINKGYQKIISMEDKLRTLKLSEFFKTIGMNIMSTVGGSSGVLYGDSFLKASNVVADIEELNLETGYEFLKTALEAMMARGKAKPGDKTMIDPLYKTVEAYKSVLDSGMDRTELSKLLKEAAEKGMLETKDMVAQKGRATYREDKGVGFIDAGAVTMYYQLNIMSDFIDR